MIKLHAILLIAFFLVLDISYRTNIDIIGDGVEYLMMTESIHRHGSPDLRPDDVARAKLRSSRFSTNGSQIIEENIHLDAQSYGYYKALNGRFYSYHFWLYPLVNVPAFEAMRALKLPPTLSFPITNALAILAVAIVALTVPWLELLQGLTIAFGAVVFGTTFYVKWTHPEVLTFSLVLAGCVFLVGNRLKTAALLFALAAQQNPPIGLLACIAAAVELLHAYKDRSDWEGCVNRTWPVVIIGLILLASPLFYYAHFGVPNMIVTAGGASSQLMTLQRFTSFFLDLDQGVVVGVPMLAPGIIASVVLSRRFERPVWIYAFLVLAPFALAVPSLTTTNWNSGANVFMRYCYWAVAPWVVLLAILQTRWKSFSMLIVGMQASYIAVFQPLDQIWNNLSRSSAASFALQHLPDWYNPDPAVFAERIHPPYRDGLAYYVVHRNAAVKILARRGSENDYLTQICKTSPSSVRVVELVDGFVYLNPIGCTVGRADGQYVVELVH